MAQCDGLCLLQSASRKSLGKADVPRKIPLRHEFLDMTHHKIDDFSFEPDVFAQTRYHDMLDSRLALQALKDMRKVF